MKSGGHMRAYMCMDSIWRVVNVISTRFLLVGVTRCNCVWRAQYVVELIVYIPIYFVLDVSLSKA